MKEPETDQEFEKALEKLNHEVIDTSSGFKVYNKKTHSTTGLDAEDLSSALFEAWNLVKE